MRSSLAFKTQNRANQNKAIDREVQDKAYAAWKKDCTNALLPTQTEKETGSGSFDYDKPPLSPAWSLIEKLAPFAMPYGQYPAFKPQPLPMVPMVRQTGAAKPIILGRLGSLEVRMAQTAGEVRRAQRLRYRVFYQEMNAAPDYRTERTRRDADEFDPICDHLIVLDHQAKSEADGGKGAKIVGTYRVLRQEVAQSFSDFYSQGEFNLRPLLKHHHSARFAELGRSCVLPSYRGKRTLELLWQGIWAYSVLHQIDVYIGVASFAGANSDLHSLPLSYLKYHTHVPHDWYVRAHDSVFEPMDRLPEQAVNEADAISAMPPLVKGYLRVGAYFGDGAYLDHQFGTTDVLIIMPVANIHHRYAKHYDSAAQMNLGQSHFSNV